MGKTGPAGRRLDLRRLKCSLRHAVPCWDALVPQWDARKGVPKLNEWGRQSSACQAGLPSCWEGLFNMGPAVDGGAQAAREVMTAVDSSPDDERVSLGAGVAASLPSGQIALLNPRQAPSASPMRDASRSS